MSSVSADLTAWEKRTMAAARAGKAIFESRLPALYEEFCPLYRAHRKAVDPTYVRLADYICRELKKTKKKVGNKTVFDVDMDEFFATTDRYQTWIEYLANGGLLTKDGNLEGSGAAKQTPQALSGPNKHGEGRNTGGENSKQKTIVAKGTGDTKETGKGRAKERVQEPSSEHGVSDEEEYQDDENEETDEDREREREAARTAAQGMKSKAKEVERGYDNDTMASTKKTREAGKIPGKAKSKSKAPRSPTPDEASDVENAYAPSNSNAKALVPKKSLTLPSALRTTVPTGSHKPKKQAFVIPPTDTSPAVAVVEELNVVPTQGQGRIRAGLCPPKPSKLDQEEPESEKKKDRRREKDIKGEEGGEEGKRTLARLRAEAAARDTVVVVDEPCWRCRKSGSACEYEQKLYEKKLEKMLEKAEDPRARNIACLLCQSLRVKCSQLAPGTQVGLTLETQLTDYIQDNNDIEGLELLPAGIEVPQQLGHLFVGLYQQNLDLRVKNEVMGKTLKELKAAMETMEQRAAQRQDSLRAWLMKDHEDGLKVAEDQHRDIIEKLEGVTMYYNPPRIRGLDIPLPAPASPLRIRSPTQSPALPTVELPKLDLPGDKVDNMEVDQSNQEEDDDDDGFPDVVFPKIRLDAVKNVGKKASSIAVEKPSGPPMTMSTGMESGVAAPDTRKEATHPLLAKERFPASTAGTAPSTTEISPKSASAGPAPHSSGKTATGKGSGSAGWLSRGSSPLSDLNDTDDEMPARILLTAATRTRQGSKRKAASHDLEPEEDDDNDDDDDAEAAPQSSPRKRVRAAAVRPRGGPIGVVRGAAPARGAGRGAGSRGARASSKK